MAIAPGQKPSTVVSAAYEIALPQAAAPAFSPAAGTYTTAESVAISDSTPGALIYYTLDGGTPTTASTLYTGPVVVSKTETITAYAVASGFDSSPVGIAVYAVHLPAPTPTISTATGVANTTYGTSLGVTIADADPGATIYYAVGAAPSSSSTRYTGPINVSSPETINAIAVDVAGGYSQSAEASQAFTVTEASPVLSRKAGSIAYGSQVSITDPDPNATIHYTTGSAAPTISSPVYSAPITITTDETINAIATNLASGYLTSGESTAAYTLPNPTPTPAIHAVGGVTQVIYPSSASVTIGDSDPSASIYYTTDGSSPSPTHGTRYSSAFIVTETETVNALAVDVAGGNPPSAVASQAFKVVEATPVFTPAAGPIANGSRVTISDADPAAAIYYTTNGSVATTAATAYAGPVAVTATETINAVAINTKAGTNYALSVNAAAAYTIQAPAPAPTITATSGGTTAVYPAKISVSIADSDTTAAIYYTLDGSTPSRTHGAKYTKALTVASTETVSAIASDSPHGYADSAVSSQPFSIMEAAPILSPPGGTITAGTKVTITDADAAATIYYTTNGSAATTDSAKYAGPITLAGSTTVNVVAANSKARTIYTQSADVLAFYQLGGSAPTPTISASGGITATTYPSAFLVTIADSDATAIVYYTTDGTTPSSANGAAYTAPFTVSSTLTVTAVATDLSHGFSSSALNSQPFTVMEAKPSISPSSGTVSKGAQATITDADPHASIFYTIDGSQATTSSTAYTGPITVDASRTINAIAADIRTGALYTASLEASVAYTVAAGAPSPVITTAGNATSVVYPGNLSVAISDSDGSATIYYTNDGSTPSATNGTSYTAPFNVSATETITAIAIDSGQSSPTTSLALTVVEAKPIFTPDPGLIASGSKVSLLDADPGAAIYYTTNGSAPTTSSTKYNNPIVVSSALTINAIAINATSGTKYAQSEESSATYTPFAGTTISGTVSSGAKPIVGATLQLFAAGTTGYGKGAKSLTTVPAVVTTDASGGFSMGYSCPVAPGDQLYVVASGGSTTGGESEGAIVLMAALGACGKLAVSDSVAINELTTVASAYSLSNFASASTDGGIAVGAPVPNSTCISGGASIAGNSSCNYRGMASAFLTPSNLVDAVSGKALMITEFYSGNDPNNLNGWSGTYGDPGSACPGSTCLSPNNPVPEPALNTSLAPYQRVNTLGNILASCVDEPDNCAALSGLAGGAADTLQAALYIAQHPGAWSGKTGLYSLVSNPGTPFTPPYGDASSTLKSEPNDWGLAISFTGGGLGIDPQVDFDDYLTNEALAFDADGNLWVTASAPSSNITSSIVGTIAGFDPLGRALTAPTALVSGVVGLDPSNGYSTYGGFGPDATSHHTTGVGVFTQPNSFMVDSTQHLWVSNNFNTEDPGGSEVTIAKNPVPGASNLTLSAASPTFNLPDEGISLVADNTGNIWQTIEDITLWEYDNTGNFQNLVSLFPSGPNVYAFCNAVFDTTATLWVDDCGAEGDGGQIFAVAPAAGQILGTYEGASTGLTAIGTLAAGSKGNVYACNTAQTSYLVFNTNNLTTPVNTFTPANNRCGQFLTVDGAGRIWSYGNTANGSVLDEVDSNGTQLTPDTGLTAISPEETVASGLALFNESAFNGQGGMAIDASGNLWFLNGVAGSPGVDTSPANALVEFVGVAAPTITPTAVATQNGAQGTRP
jgi:hypothetical protein